MAARRLAWVLNLDADLELAARQAYTPSRSVREAMKPWSARLAETLLAPDDVIVDDASPPLSAKGLVGRAFCPTPRAVAALVRAGAEPEPHPGVDVLRRVNARAFAASLGQTIPGAAFVTELDDARAVLATPPVPGTAWRAKRNFGMTGRGQRVLRGPLDADLAFVRAGLDEGGVQLEPNLAIDTEYAIHGLLDGSGALELGSLVRQLCDTRGAWLGTEPVAAPAVFERLEREARSVAAALTSAGYFGPFGIDAYSYRGVAGALELQPRSEINARYSMGFAIGFGPCTR